MSTPQSGGCLCGAVRFTATPLKTAMHACHCAVCRRWAGGPFMGVHCADDMDIQNTAELGVYVSSEWAERAFCRRCGSSLVWRLQNGGHVVVSAQAFDDPAAFVLAEEIFIDQKPPNYALAGDAPRLTGEEVFERFNAGAA
jgi:hypothetical protein